MINIHYLEFACHYPATAEAAIWAYKSPAKSLGLFEPQERSCCNENKLQNTIYQEGSPVSALHTLLWNQFEECKVMVSVSILSGSFSL
jgi:hypothetical protein